MNLPPPSHPHPVAGYSGREGIPPHGGTGGYKYLPPELAMGFLVGRGGGTGHGPAPPKKTGYRSEPAFS